MSVREDELLARIAELEEALTKAQQDALTDELTGCLNRRGWQRALRTEQGRCTRHGLDAVIAVIDLNKFKALNDGAGHHVGDKVLCRCAEALCRATRSCDTVARIGGDEFAVLAVQTTPSATDRLDDRLRDALNAAEVDATVACAALSDHDSLEQAWHAADLAMLARKAG